MIMTTNDPVWIAVTFAECPCEYHAQLRISANNDKRLKINIVHNHVKLYDLAGNGTLNDFQIADGDTLLIVVYDGCKIIACGEFDVRFDLIGKLSIILDPKLSKKLIVDQHSQKLIDRAAARALEAVCGVSTGELVVAEVAR